MIRLQGYCNEHPDPLPPDTPEQLHAIDAMLWQQAMGDAAPGDLTERVFQASAPHLPQAALKFPAAGPASGRMPMLSRMSMAAAVLLSVSVGVLFLRSPEASRSTLQIAHNGVQSVPIASHHSTQHLSLAQPLGVEQEWILLNSVQLSHYSEMRHLTWDDVTDDLASLVRELEM